MDINEFKIAIKGNPKEVELVEFFENSVSAEKNRGITEYRTVNQRLKKYKEALERIGYDGVADIDEFTTTLIDTVEGKKAQGGNELSEMQANLKKLQRSFELSQSELKSEREVKESLQKQNKIKTIEGKLFGRLNDEVNDPQLLIDSYMSKGRLDLGEDGEVIYKDGEKILNLDDGVKHIINSHPSLRKNKQVPGAGSTVSNGQGSQSKPKYTLEQIKTMTPEQAAADIKNVNESIKSYS